MNEEQQRKTIQIANALGWNAVRYLDGVCYGLDPNKPDGIRRLVPKWFTSLDACAEARAKLTEEQRFVYVQHLIAQNPDGMSPWDIANATAPQVAEALWRTLCQN